MGWRTHPLGGADVREALDLLGFHEFLSLLLFF